MGSEVAVTRWGECMWIVEGRGDLVIRDLKVRGTRAKRASLTKDKQALSQVYGI
jgi:hypothetical protein